MKLLCDGAIAEIERLGEAASQGGRQARRKTHQELAKLSVDALRACAVLDYQPGVAVFSRLNACVMQGVSCSLPSSSIASVPWIYLTSSS